MRQVLIVGGASGIGLALATVLAERVDCERVVVVDRDEVPAAALKPKMESVVFDLTESDYSVFDRYAGVDAVMVTAGFGRLALFRDVDEEEIEHSFRVNTVAAMRLVRRFYGRLESPSPFRMGVMVSIAGYLSSPFFSVYAATKAALRVFIESVNVELQKAGSANCVLNVSPGSIRGTRFGGGTHTDVDGLRPLATDILTHLEQGDDLFIPQYDEVYRAVLERYHRDFRAEGLHSYEYKEARLKKKE